MFEGLLLLGKIAKYINKQDKMKVVLDLGVYRLF